MTQNLVTITVSGKLQTTQLAHSDQKRLLSSQFNSIIYFHLCVLYFVFLFSCICILSAVLRIKLLLSYT